MHNYKPWSRYFLPHCYMPPLLCPCLVTLNRQRAQQHMASLDLEAADAAATQATGPEHPPRPLDDAERLVTLQVRRLGGVG